MKVWQEILQRLRSGEAPEEVRRAYRSDSQFAKAIRVYVDESAGKAEEIREKNRQEDLRLKLARSEDEQLRTERTLLEKDVDCLREEKKALSVQVQSERQALDGLRADADVLMKAGFTPDVIEKIRSSWAKNGEEALSVLQKLDKAVELRDEVRSLGLRETALKRSTGLLDAKQQKTAKNLASIENLLDRTRAEVVAMQKGYLCR